MTSDANEQMQRGAAFDRSRRYRHLLTREWDAALPRIAWCLLNPSTADAMRDDPTIRRCIRFSQRWGFGSMHAVNIFSWRATIPRELRECEDPVGPSNDRAIRRIAGENDLLVVAWGAYIQHVRPEHRTRHDRVLELIKHCPSVVCLGQTASGMPRHPLYLRADSRRERFVAPPPASVRRVRSGAVRASARA